MADKDWRYRYAGMSYGNASREGLQLLQRAAETGSWFDIPERLIALRQIMQRQMNRAVHGTAADVAPGESFIGGDHAAAARCNAGSAHSA